MGRASFFDCETIPQCLLFIITKFRKPRLSYIADFDRNLHKKTVPFLVRFTLHRDVLSSQEAILQLLSALLSLTSVFGMGTGVASMPSSRHGI